MTTPPDVLTLLKAQTGDLKAFDLVLRAVQQPLYRYLLRMTGDSVAAKDLLQEVFVLIFNKLYSLQNPALFQSWIFRLASREAFRFLKKQSKLILIENTEGGVFDEFDEPTEAENWTFYLEQLPDLIEKLSPNSRAVILLHFLEGLKLAEIAEILDAPLGTVKSRLAYGLACLRQEFAKIKFDSI